LAIELTVVSVHWRRWPSFIVQRVAENGAADVSYFTRRMEPSSFGCAQWCRLLHCEMWCLPSGAVYYTGACYKPFVAMEAFL